MTAHELTESSRAVLKLHGHAGLLIIFLAEALLFSGNQVVGRWFTPIVCAGCALLTYSPAYKLKGRSHLVTDCVESLIATGLLFSRSTPLWKSSQSSAGYGTLAAPKAFRGELCESQKVGGYLIAYRVVTVARMD